MSRKHIAFPCVGRTRITRQILHQAIRRLHREGIKVIQISAQRAYNLPYPCPAQYNRLIIPNVTTLGQVYTLKQQGFTLCDLRTTESKYHNAEHWFDMSLSLREEDAQSLSRAKLDQLSQQLYLMLLNNKDWRFSQLPFEINPRLRHSFLG